MDDEANEPNETYRGGLTLDELTDDQRAIYTSRTLDRLAEAELTWPDVYGWVASTEDED